MPVLDRHVQQTAAFILPLMAFLVIASLAPEFAEMSSDGPELLEHSQAAARWYVGLVTLQVLVAVSLLFYFRKIYLQDFPLRLSWLSLVVGVLGVILWIAVCECRLEQQFYGWIGLQSLAHVRPAFNPFESLHDDGFRSLFLVLRFTLLAALVPLVEELFLRGWLIRWVENPDWESVGLRQLSWKALITPSIYGVLTHPSEAIAAILWFGLVTLLMMRTRNLWDCVVAHAVTNLLLGIYVVKFSAWHLW